MSVSITRDYNHNIHQVTSNTMNVSDFIDIIRNQMKECFENSTRLMVYNVGGVAYPFANKRGNTQFYNFASPVEGTEYLESVVTIDGGTINGKIFKHIEQPNSIVFYADSEVPIGLFLKYTQSFYLYLDVFIQSTDMSRKIAGAIAKGLTVLNERFSWLKNPGDEYLVNLLKRHNNIDREHEMENLKREIRREEERAAEYRRHLSQALNRRITQSQKLMQLESSDSDLSKHIIEQIEMLRTVPLVTDVHIKDGYISIYTDDIYIYEPESENRFHAGKYEIRVNMSNSDIQFFNFENLRRSYWGRSCHHPHVSESGNPCLGNIATTIAELCSTRDVYGIAVVAINFLESVNIEDSAGRYIRNWDQVDEDNNIIKKANPNGNPNEECSNCGEGRPIRVFTELDEDGDPRDVDLLCGDCAEDQDVFFSHHYDVYLLGELTEHPAIQDTEDQREYL